MARRVLIPLLVLALLTLALAPLAQGGWALTVTHKINVHPSIQERGWREAFCYNHITSKTYHYDFWVKELEGVEVLITPMAPRGGDAGSAAANAVVIYDNGTTRWVDVYAVLPREMATENVHHIVIDIVDEIHEVTCWDPESGNTTSSTERTVTEHAKVDSIDLGSHTLYWKPDWKPGEPFYFNGTLYIAVAAPIGAHVEDPVVPAEPQPSPPLPPGGNTTTPRGSVSSVSPALLGLGAIAALFLLLARR